MDDIVLRYAKATIDVIEAKIKAKEEALKLNGLTSESYKQLEKDVGQAIGENGHVDTEFGRVQMKPPGKVQWFPLRSTTKPEQKPFLIYERDKNG